jgi:hypothetical protein
MNSWHKGQPRDLRKTTTDICSSDGLPIRSSIVTSSPFTEKNDFLRIASRGFELRAISEGFPENTVSWQPQSSDTLAMAFATGLRTSRSPTLHLEDPCFSAGENALAKWLDEVTTPAADRIVSDFLKKIMVRKSRSASSIDAKE